MRKSRSKLAEFERDVVIEHIRAHLQAARVWKKEGRSQ